MAQVALGVVGGVVGFMLGGPAGAAIGFGIGMALTPEMPGATIGEIAKQTAKEGDPRLIVWGIVRPVGPNIIASEDPPRRYQVSQGGKGSGPTSEAIYRTYALGVCEGPITGYRRIWRNNKLVYDGRNGSVWGALNNPVFLQKATFYYGDYDQMPDPNLEAVFGVGNVPAHRGTAYIVIADEDLTDTGGAVPQWLFEVVRAQYEYEPESTELIISHAGAPQLRRVSTEDWSYIDSPTLGSGTSYGSDYTQDGEAIVSSHSLQPYMRVYSASNNDLIHSQNLTTQGLTGVASSVLDDFALGGTTNNKINTLAIIEGADGSYSYSFIDDINTVVSGSVNALEYSPDGSVLAAGHARWAVIGEPAEDAQHLSIYNVSTGYTKIAGSAPTWPASTNGAMAIAWATNGSRIYVAQQAGPAIRILNYPWLYEVGYPTDMDNSYPRVTAMHVHPNGIWIALGRVDGVVEVRSTLNMDYVETTFSAGSQIMDVRFSPGGKYLAYTRFSASDSSPSTYIRLVEDWTVQATFETQTAWQVRWSPLQPVGL